MARLLSKEGVLFQHIPRTGGTWIEKVLDELKGVKVVGWYSKQPKWLPKKHCLLSHYYRSSIHQVRWIWANVRYPIAYYESVWKWLKRSTRSIKVETKWTWHPHAKAAHWYKECLDGTFNDWIYLMLEKEPGWYTRLIESYVGPDGGEFCDYIGRTEFLFDDFIDAMKRFGYESEVEKSLEAIKAVKKANTTSTDRIEWDDDLKCWMLRSEKLMIDRFYGDNANRRCYARLDPENALAVQAERTR